MREDVSHTTAGPSTLQRGDTLIISAPNNVADGGKTKVPRCPRVTSCTRLAAPARRDSTKRELHA